MAFIYKQAKTDLVNGTHDWDEPTQTYKVALLKSSYTPSALHIFMSDLNLATNEASGTGYVAGFAGSGRRALTARTVTPDAVADRSELDAADVQWTGLNAGAIAGVVVYRHLTSDADSKVIAFIDGGGLPITPVNEDLSITWNAEGVLQLT